MFKLRRASNSLFAPRRRTGELQCSPTRSQTRHEMDCVVSKKPRPLYPRGKNTRK